LISLFDIDAILLGCSCLLKIIHLNVVRPDFEPHESCLFDAFQLKYIPGSQQECPRPQFSQNEDYTCFPNTLINGEWEWECPEDYHWTEDDETGQCYQDAEGCRWDNYMLESEDGEGNSCRALYNICDHEEHREGDYCLEYCEEYPDGLTCKPEQENDNFHHNSIGNSCIVTAVPATNVNASSLSLNDFDSNPEGVCVTHGDEPGMETCMRLDRCIHIPLWVRIS
jgi:hypothetical protein